MRARTSLERFHGSCLPTLCACACAIAIPLAPACDSGASRPPADIGPGGPPAGRDGGATAPVGDGGAVGEAAAQDAGGGGDAAVGPPRCDPSTTWSVTGPVASIPPAGLARFGGISADELSVAWTGAMGDGGAAGAVVQVADRASRAAAFGAPSTLPASAPALAADRVALGAKGTTLIAVKANRTAFVAFERAGAGAPWTASLPSVLATVNASNGDPGGGAFSEPVLGADDRSFFYVRTPASGSPVLLESTWDAALHAWQQGASFPNPELAAVDATHLRRPTGVSSDGRTLFFRDESTSTERAAWRDAPGGAFTLFLDATGVSEAAPNARCDTLYFQGSADAGGSSVFTAQ